MLSAAKQTIQPMFGLVSIAAWSDEASELTQK